MGWMEWDLLHLALMMTMSGICDELFAFFAASTPLYHISLWPSAIADQETPLSVASRSI